MWVWLCCRLTKCLVEIELLGQSLKPVEPLR